MTNSIGHGAAAALLQDQHAKELVQREIRLLQRLQSCPNVVRYVDSQLQPGSGGRHKMEALILMEFCSGTFRTHMAAQRATVGREAMGGQQLEGQTRGLTDRLTGAVALAGWL